MAQPPEGQGDESEYSGAGDTGSASLRPQPAPPRFQSPRSAFSRFEDDGYSMNPETISWSEGSPYEPWPEHTDERVVGTLSSGVTQPPHVGMLERADTYESLQRCITHATSDVRAPWGRLLKFYDVAMRGKVDAFTALRGAHTRIRTQQDELQTCIRHKNMAEHRLDELNKDIDRMEQEKWEQIGQIETLEKENTTVVRNGVALNREYTKLAAAQQTHIEVLEEIAANWESLTGTAKARPTAPGGRDPEARFEAVRATIQKNAAEASRNAARYEDLKDKYDQLQTEYYEVAERPELFKQPPLPKGASPINMHSDYKARIAQLGDHNRVLMLELETYKRGAARKSDQYTLEIVRQEAQIHNLEAEAALHKTSFKKLQSTVDDLLFKLATFGSFNEQQYKNNIKELAKCVRELEALIANALNIKDVNVPGYIGPGSIEEMLLLEAALRDRDEARGQNILSSGALVKDIKAGLAGIHARMSGGRLSDERLSDERMPGQIDDPNDPILATQSKSSTLMDIVRSGWRAVLGTPRQAEEPEAPPYWDTEPDADQAENMKKLIQHEIAKISAEVDLLSKQFEEMKEGESDIQERLDTLHQQVSPQQLAALRSVSQEIRSPVPQVEAALETKPSLTASETKPSVAISETSPDVAISERSPSVTVSETSPSVAASGKKPSLERSVDPSWYNPLGSPSGVDDPVIESLEAAIEPIAQLKAAPPEVGVEEAARKCSEQLVPIIKGLKSDGSDSPAGHAIVALQDFLEERVSQGIKDDQKPSFYQAVDEHDRDIKRLLEQERYSLRQSVRDLDLLDSIREKLAGLRRLQVEQKELMDEYEEYRLQQARRPPSPEQSAKIWHLASNLVKNTRNTRNNQLDIAAMGRLVRQIQDLTADPYWIDRKKELEDDNSRVDARVSELRELMEHGWGIATAVQKQKETLGTLSKDPDRPRSEGMANQEFNERYEAGVARREKDLWRAMQINKEALQSVRTNRDHVDKYIDTQTDHNRRRSEKLLAETLVRVQASSPSSKYGQDTCFCTLLHTFFPGVYHSVVYGGCCYHGQIAPSHDHPYPRASKLCPGHPHPHGHGHGVLSASGILWTALCSLLTSLTWLALLVLYQPYNIQNTAAFFLALLHGLYHGLPRRLHAYFTPFLRYLYFRLRYLFGFGLGFPPPPHNYEFPAHLRAVPSVLAHLVTFSYAYLLFHFPRLRRFLLRSIGSSSSSSDPSQPPPASNHEFPTHLRAVPGFLAHLVTFSYAYLLFHFPRLRRFFATATATATTTAPPKFLYKPQVEAAINLVPPFPEASEIVGSVVTLFLVYAWLCYVAVVVERRIWTGSNDWRFAYLLDLKRTDDSMLPYAGWSPVSVDWRLVVEPVWGRVEDAVHRLLYAGVRKGLE